MKDMPAYKTMDEYIALFPAEVQSILNKIRALIRSIAPEAGEKIGYGIPTFTLNGNLVHFAAYEHHIGFYPGPDGIEKFKSEFGNYVVTKGTVQFPLDQPIPYDLIRRITEYRVAANRDKKAR